MLLMPRSGGAIQLAILPASYTGCMTEETKAWSWGIGIQCGRPAANASGEIGWPDGSVGAPAQLPTVRRNRVLGRRSSNFTPPFSMMRFQRFTPFSQSRMYELRMISFMALRIG